MGNVAVQTTGEVGSSLYAAPWVARALTMPTPGRRLHLEPQPREWSVLAVFEGARTSVLIDGQIYNAAELAEMLHMSPSVGAAAILARAYEAWGLDFMQRVRGIFALVLIDESNDRLVAVRDALGAIPLFYAEAAGQTLISTSAAALRETPGVSRAFNRAALADHLCHRWPDQHETFFAGVRRLPPGYMLVNEHGTTRVVRYWEPTPLDRPIEWIDDDEVQPLFDAAFERAVSRTLDHGPSGIFLSGGLDSISVAAMSVDAAGRRRVPLPLALSLGFPGDSDEELEQRGVAAVLGLKHEFVPFGDATPQAGLLSGALDLTGRQAAPLLNTWMPAYTTLVNRAKALGVNVVTSGAGGDEWLAVSPFLAADLIRSADVAGLSQLMQGWRRSYRMSPLRVARCLLWRYGARPLGADAIGRIAPATWKANRVARALRGIKPWVAGDPALRSELEARVMESIHTAANRTPSYYLRDVRSTLEHPLTVLEMEEIYEMGRRLDVRFLHPYWDAEVVDILYRTRPLRLFADGRSKSVVRQTMANRFPGLGLEHQKKRSGTRFYASVLDREIPGLWAQQPTFSELADLGVIIPSAVKAMGNTSVATKNGIGLVSIWDLMNVNTWVRAHQ
jgi:asparagine synthetase B (glutamine-hydrolysing)